MKWLHGEYATVEEANAVVKSLIDDGNSAWRQGLQVFMDDGGVDDGYSENDFF